MTTHEDRLTPDIETPAQYRDRMARLAEAGEEPYTAEEDDDEEDDDEFGGENDVEESAPTKATEDPVTAAGKSLGELAALRPSRDEYGYDTPSQPMAVLPVGEKLAATETESLLNSLIGECGSLLRDVAFRSACLTPDASERIRFISAAESLAVTATKVADAIGRLRHGEPPVVDTHRHELIYTHVHSAPPSPRRSGKSSHQ
jgi:hypothetical protein